MLIAVTVLAVSAGVVKSLAAVLLIASTTSAPAAVSCSGADIRNRTCTAARVGVGQIDLTGDLIRSAVRPIPGQVATPRQVSRPTRSSAPLSKVKKVAAAPAKATKAPQQIVSATSGLASSGLARFVPTPVLSQMQPAPLIVVGLPVNFYADTGQADVHGTLLGQPAIVRFTPIGYWWNYGDGSKAHRLVGGTALNRQDAAVFRATPTSHVFSQSGTYLIDLTVTMSAQYKFAEGEWIPVHGTVTVTANQLSAVALTAHTLLMGKHCMRDAAGRAVEPGC